MGSTVYLAKDKLYSQNSSLASFPGAEEGEESAWYTLFAHARNYSKSHMVELGACTNMTINGSREQHKLS